MVKMWEEEEVQKNSEWWVGLDDEIGPLEYPSPERLRDSPLFSPQRAFTGWCDDQVLSPPRDLFGAFQCEWASSAMDSPQRSLTGWCADQEQLLKQAKLTYLKFMNRFSTRVKAPSRLFERIHTVGGLTGELPGDQEYSLEGRGVEVNNLMDHYIGQKVERAEKSCIAISHLKKKNIVTDTPKRKYKTKRLITLDDLQQLFGLKRVEAAKTLRVSVPTFKRYCRQNGITWWNGDGCSLFEPKLLNNSVHQNSPGSKPPEVEGEKETSALLIAKQDMVTVKAKYGERTLKFRLSLESGVTELNEAVAKRVELELGNFIVEYEDDDQERVWIACDEDLQECVKFSSSLGNQVIRLLVTDKVFNSEKSRESCKGLKRKRS